MKKDTWQDRILAAANGTQTGAIVRCILNKNGPDETPRFVGKASCTSDGFLMCNFVGHDGEYHMGAFVGSADDLAENIRRLCIHCKLNAVEVSALGVKLAAWIALDYRPQVGRSPARATPERRAVSAA